MEKLYTGSKKKKILGTDCGSYHELLIAKFRLKLKKVGKTMEESNGNPLQYSYLGKSHGWRNLVGCSPWGREESDTTE